MKIIAVQNWTKRELENARREAHTHWLNSNSKEQSDYYNQMIDRLTILILSK